MGENADAAGETLGDFEDVSGQDHRRAAGDPFGDEVFDLPRGSGVETGQRLVEHEELGVVNQRAGERRLLLHAAGKALATLAAVGPKAELGEQELAFFARNRRFDAPQARDEFQVFERIELVIEHRLVGQPGDDALGFDGIAPRVDAENSDFAGVPPAKARRPCEESSSCRRHWAR